MYTNPLVKLINKKMTEETVLFKKRTYKLKLVKECVVMFICNWIIIEQLGSIPR